MVGYGRMGACELAGCKADYPTSNAGRGCGLGAEIGGLEHETTALRNVSYVSAAGMLDLLGLRSVGYRAAAR